MGREVGMGKVKEKTGPKSASVGESLESMERGREGRLHVE